MDNFHFDNQEHILWVPVWIAIPTHASQYTKHTCTSMFCYGQKIIQKKIPTHLPPIPLSQAMRGVKITTMSVAAENL